MPFQLVERSSGLVRELLAKWLAALEARDRRLAVYLASEIKVGARLILAHPRACGEYCGRVGLPLDTSVERAAESVGCFFVCLTEWIMPEPGDVARASDA